MRWRRLALAGGAAIGAAAAFNALVARRAAPLLNPLGGEAGTFVWRGHRVAWTRRGRGHPVLLVHGPHAAAWSDEWRHVVDRLAATNAVWTLDLLGFGRSDRPDVRYAAALYVALLDDFTRQVVAEPCALVGVRLSAAYTVALAARGARRFPALVLVSPVGVAHRPLLPARAARAARALLAAPLVGTTLFNASVTRVALRARLRRAFAGAVPLTRELVDSAWATAHQPGARRAPAALAGRALELNVRDALRRLEQPVLITWGERARDVPAAELAAYRAGLPDAEVEVFPATGSLPHVERPEAWCDAVRGFLTRAWARAEHAERAEHAASTGASA